MTRATRSEGFVPPPAARNGFPLLALVATLALFLALAHGAALTAPFFSDDYILIDKVRGAPWFDLFRPRALAYGWYRPLGRELHFWAILRLFPLDPLPFHAACFALWLSTLGLYAALARRLVGEGPAALATAGAAALAAWGVPIEWGPGAQELWMMVLALLSLHAFARARTLLATLALGAALLCKESAAIVPGIAWAWSLAIDRRTPAQAARAAAPLASLVAVWALLHPLLGGRLWGNLVAPLPPAPAAPLTALTRTLLSLVNLDLRPAPLSGWRHALGAAVPSALVLGSLAALSARASTPPQGDGAPSVPSPGRVVVLGIAWALFGWVPLFWPGLSWQAYYTLFGSLGVWLALARLLARRRSLATALIFGIALLRGARADTPAREWGNERLQRFGKSFMQHTEHFLRDHLPSLPPHARLYFTAAPRGVVFLTGHGDAPALRVWYHDPTIEGRYWSDYRERGRDEPAGPDYFFRYDSLASWIEVVRGPEDVRRARAIDPRWEQDHARLADVLALGDDWERAADEYRKLAREAPDHPDYAHNVAVCLEAAGDTAAARAWRNRAPKEVSGGR